ncbi:hypothetical protein [Lactococcus garvieae]|uniref:hypothetical protein n=1 Tax=Lactococcus garvieae TaxID=1363 RepID=UPI0022E1F983|nr:hypothetical protein [Lactococcus garvieae]
MIKSKVILHDLVVSLAFMTIWVFQIFKYGGTSNHLSIVKVCMAFAAFILVTIGLLISRLQNKIEMGIWSLFAIHCLSTNTIVTMYIFQKSDAPLFDSILVNIIVILVLLIQYSYENNKYYGE